MVKKKKTTLYAESLNEIGRQICCRAIKIHSNQHAFRDAMQKRRDEMKKKKREVHLWN